MAEFTLLELHFENADLTANAPYSHGEKEVGASDAQPADEASSKRNAFFAAIVGLGFCVALAYAVRKRVFSDNEAGDDVPTETKRAKLFA